MPLPKALQAALDSTPVPDQTGNVFDFESANKTVVPSSDPVVDTSSDNWLEELAAGDDTAPATPDASTVDDMFTTDDTVEDGEFSFPDIDAEPSTSQFDELKGIIEGLEGKINKTDAEEAQKQALEDAVSALKDKYPDVDQDILDNFSDLHNTFRSSVGKELETEMIKVNLANEKRIKDLESKIEALGAKADTSPIPDEKSNPNDYRNLMAEAVPEYQKIIGSKQFKQLMSTPVDADNPEFTFNKKLGKLYGQRRTADILKFFSSFAGKYMANDGSKGAVVDGGVSSSSQGGQSPERGLSPDRLRSILNKVMRGELKLSEAEMTKLRQMAAKQAMS